MPQLSASQVYDRLVNVDKILTLNGQIRFNLGQVGIVVKQRDVVGNLMQEWLEEWMRRNSIVFSVNSNTQMPPDFYLNPDNKTKDLLEVKAFYYKGTPGFDIAAFDMFEKEVMDNPYVLDTAYLIFGYDMDITGNVTIKKVWLKKVWEICRPMKTRNGTIWPINLQIKHGVVHKIRPGKWYGKQSKYPIFKGIGHFVAALEETVFQNPATHQDGASWRQLFEKNYSAYYGTNLNFPRWSDIKHIYNC